MGYDWIKYKHVCRLGTVDVEGILEPEHDRWVFPKLDGTNATAWCDNEGVFHLGSRNRELSAGKDNAGIYAAYLTGKLDALVEECKANPGYVFYGEWLNGTGCIKSYLQGGFWLFDIKHLATGEYMDPAHWIYPMTRAFEVDPWIHVIQPLEVVGEGRELTGAEVVNMAKGCHYNLPDGTIGEGVVIKNYGFRNRWGRLEFAKVVLEEYNAHKGEKAPKKTSCALELAICGEFVTSADYGKCLAKCRVEYPTTPDLELIPKVGAMAFDDLIREEMPEVLKLHPGADIDFRKLKGIITRGAAGYIKGLM